MEEILRFVWACYYYYAATYVARGPRDDSLLCVRMLCVIADLG